MYEHKIKENAVYLLNSKEQKTRNSKSLLVWISNPQFLMISYISFFPDSVENKDVKANFIDFVF